VYVVYTCMHMYMYMYMHERGVCGSVLCFVLVYVNRQSYVACVHTHTHTHIYARVLVCLFVCLFVCLISEYISSCMRVCGGCGRIDSHTSNNLRVLLLKLDFPPTVTQTKAADDDLSNGEPSLCKTRAFDFASTCISPSSVYIYIYIYICISHSLSHAHSVCGCVFKLQRLYVVFEQIS